RFPLQSADPERRCCTPRTAIGTRTACADSGVRRRAQTYGRDDGEIIGRRRAAAQARGPRDTALRGLPELDLLQSVLRIDEEIAIDADDAVRVRVGAD